MHTFRFNPVFKQWVLLGTSYAATPTITKNNLLDVGRNGKFVAANHPRQPFLLEPSNQKDHSDLVYAGESPVGEYELMLYEGKDPLFVWGAKEWEGWLNLVQRRLLQLQHNPHLHYVHLTVDTGMLKAVDGDFQRVGDLIAASHPLCGMSTLLDREMADKIRHKEQIFTVQEDGYGTLIVPSAPTRQHEVWYLPMVSRSSLARLDPAERKALARTLSVLVGELKAAYPHEEFNLSFHTDLLGNQPEQLWWLQVHQTEPGVESPLPVRALPELFVRKLQTMFHAAG